MHSLLLTRLWHRFVCPFDWCFVRFLVLSPSTFFILSTIQTAPHSRRAGSIHPWFSSFHFSFNDPLIPFSGNKKKYPTPLDWSQVDRSCRLAVGSSPTGPPGCLQFAIGVGRIAALRTSTLLARRGGTVQTQFGRRSRRRWDNTVVDVPIGSGIRRPRSRLRGGICGGGQQRDRPTLRTKCPPLAAITGHVCRKRTRPFDAGPTTSCVPRPALRRGLLRRQPPTAGHGQLQRCGRTYLPLRNGGSAQIQVT